MLSYHPPVIRCVLSYDPPVIWSVLSHHPPVKRCVILSPPCDMGCAILSPPCDTVELGSITHLVRGNVYQVYGKGPTNQLHSKPIAVSGSGHTRKRIKQLTLSSVCKKTRLKIGLSRMQLTLHATRPTPHGASCLVQATSSWSVKTRDVFRPGIVGMREYMAIRLRPCMISSTPPPHVASSVCVAISSM